VTVVAMGVHGCMKEEKDQVREKGIVSSGGAERKMKVELWRYCSSISLCSSSYFFLSGGKLKREWLKGGSWPVRRGADDEDDG